jgi:hypothetical protein
MTGRVVPLQGSEHTVVDALLPWYVNGTLAGDELARVKEHLTNCEQCRHEVDWLRDVFAACAAIAPIPGAPPLADANGIAAFAGRKEAKDFRGGISAGWRSTQPWVRMLVAAQLAGLALLGALLTLDTREEPSFRTLGAQTRPTPARDAIAVMFDPLITEAEMRRVLTSAGARIVDGPTSTNAFVLEVPAAKSGEAVQKLRAARMVLFAEPLGARMDR